MRVAAAHAIEAITGCFKHSSVMELYNLVEAQMKEACINSSVEDLVFLNVITLHEYELASDFSNNPKERAKRKQNLKRRLDSGRSPYEDRRYQKIRLQALISAANDTASLIKVVSVAQIVYAANMKLIMCGGMFNEILSQGEALKIASFMEMITSQLLYLRNFGRFSHPNPKSNIVPQAVLTKSGLVSLNTAKSVSTAQSRKTMNDAMPTTYSYYKAYSSVKRPFNKKTTNYNRYFNKRVNTVKSTRVNTARPKAEVNTVKASTSWVWKPKHEELDHVFKSNSASKTLTRYDYVDALDPKFPKKVYKVVKDLYGLHQAPRAWYATLSTFLLKSGYRRGTINKTLFIKKDKNDIMLVHVYVDDIIFGSTKQSWCDAFEALMKSRFQMSSMGELTFFLRLQVKQKEDGIFISQDKYVAEILKKFDFASVKTAFTPIETQKPLTKDEEAADVDVHLYKSMIGSLMYLTASRPDIMIAICACSRFPVTPKTSHLNAVKRIFRRLISWQCKNQTIVATSTTEAEYVVAANCYGDAYEKTLIQVLKIHTDDNVADLLTKAFDFVGELLVKRWVVDDMMNFKVDMLHEDRVNTVGIIRLYCHALLLLLEVVGTADTKVYTASFPKTIHLCDSLQSDEDSFELIELMILCTNFLTMVCDLENLKNHSSDNEESLGEDASKQGSIHDAYAIVTKEQKVDDDKETTQEVRKCLDTSP
ncbi:putative ribonuclease H-like domain-containing protein [Tanacetum coccineum]